MKTKLSDLVGYLSLSASERLSTVRVRHHRSAKSVCLKFLEPMMEEVGDTNPKHFLLNGEATFDDIVAGIAHAGFWGFYSLKEHTIHCWWNGTPSTEQLLAFIAHELEHVVYRTHRKHPNAEVREERRCDMTGAIAAKAWKILNWK